MTTKNRYPDLAGLYITDDYIDVLVGADRHPQWAKVSVSDLVVEEGGVHSFWFDEYNTLVDAFDDVGQFLLQRAPGLRSIGVGCYGPFHTIARRDRGTARYGELSLTTHGRLSEQNLPQLILGGVAALSEKPLITIETDVAAAAIGYVYTRTGFNSGQPANIDDQVVVFVKASLGIGGSFLRASTPWHGRLHPEMGQIQVPRWGDPSGFEANWKRTALNQDSVEALASVVGVEERFGAAFADLKNDPAHPAWEREAWYLAQLAWTITCMISPHRIVFGGRIMEVDGLMKRVRRVFREQVAGSEPLPDHPGLDDLENYLVASLTHDERRVARPGAIGALCIAAMEAIPVNPQHRIKARKPKS